MTTPFAGAAQGAKADTAVQPADLAPVATSGIYGDLVGVPVLGTAASTDATAYATAAQGAKADTAVQPADLAPVAIVGSFGSLTGSVTEGATGSGSGRQGEQHPSIQGLRHPGTERVGRRHCRLDSRVSVDRRAR